MASNYEIERKRKTFKVLDLVNSVNERLRVSTCSPEARHGMCSLVEEVLHSTGNYDGFRYLNVGEVPRGHLPGVRAAGIDEVNDRTIWEFPDETRRQYGCKTRS